jgi:hypothetical protein
MTKGAAKVWTSMKIGSLAGRTAKKGAKAWGSWKIAKLVGRGGKKLLIVPLAAGGGIAAWRRLRSASGNSPSSAYGSPQGPAAPSSVVTPGAPGPAAGMNATGSTLPVNPPPGTAT